MNDFIKSGKAATYASSAMSLRRKRILHEARKLLADVGLENFTIRELSLRANVSTKTLYNAFGNRDYIIGTAIREVYDEVHGNLKFRTPDCTLRGLIDRALVINRGNIKSKNYAKAISSIYFSTPASSELRKTLQDMAIGNTSIWLNNLRDEKLLEDWVEVEYIARHFANVEYGLIFDWSSGGLSDDAYLNEFAKIILIITISITKGWQKSEAMLLMSELNDFGVQKLYMTPGIS